MDEVYLMIAARYIELNPVKARLVNKAEQWEYSSAASHIYSKEDILLSRTQGGSLRKLKNNRYGIPRIEVDSGQ